MKRELFCAYGHIPFSFEKEKNVFFSFRKEKNEKKPRTFRSIVCATGSGSMAAMKDGVHAHGARVIRQSPPLSVTSCREALTRRAPCACGRGLPVAQTSRTGEVALQCEALHCDTIDFSTMLSKGIDRFPVYARRAHVGARFRLLGAVGMRLPVAR